MCRVSGQKELKLTKVKLHLPSIRYGIPTITEVWCLINDYFRLLSVWLNPEVNMVPNTCEDLISGHSSGHDCWKQRHTLFASDQWSFSTDSLFFKINQACHDAMNTSAISIITNICVKGVQLLRKRNTKDREWDVVTSLWLKTKLRRRHYMNNGLAVN